MNSTAPQPDLQESVRTKASATPAHAHDLHDHPTSTRFKAVNLAAVIIPLVGLVAAMWLLWGTGFDWVHLILMISLYLVTAFGITVGFHRLFTHRAFDTPRFMKAALAIAGSMAVQGPLLKWVAEHRAHHQHSDEDGDPHSPHLHDGSFWAVVKGAFHAHFGWLFWSIGIDHEKYVGDLRKDKMLRVINKLFPLWTVIGLVLPAVLGGLITMTWTGALLGFLWGGLARVFLVHHVTWSVNSVCHLWGRKEFRSSDESRNNPIVGVLALGEGWHNTHHAFPTSARHGLRWWQLDLSWMLIRGMQMVHLAWNVKLPSAEAIAAKQMTP